MSNAWLWLTMVAMAMVSPLRATASDARGAPQLAAALDELSHFNFDGAYRAFKGAQESSPEGSDPWQEATFGAALCAQQILPPREINAKEAASLYQLLLSKSPDSKYAPRTMLNLGRIAEVRDYFGDQVDLPRARQWYQQVVDRWPDEPIAGEATLRSAATYMQTYDPEQVQIGVAILEAWLRKHPQDPLAGGMWGYLGDINFIPLKNYPRAIECYRNADRFRFADRNRQGQVYWRAAVIADRYTNDHDTAVHYYTKLINEVPNSGMAYEAQVALRRLGAPVPEIRLIAPRSETARAGASR